MTRLVHCVKLGIEAEGLDAPPFPGIRGQEIF
ncbi:MAG: Fe(2+)-trafficking protein, partial [Methylobacter sp.]|nr:Fe(2+)-trafficking protein [Methylobacter sp.]